uniref:Putative methyltransferase n=1 Tax=viral metagenome TaxID=1070528 RepID=A0A6M3JDN5_9ZZZZ
MRPAIEAVIKNCKENVIGAEVGVYEGGHAKALLQHPNIKKLYLIDICEFKSLRKNIAPFLNKINLMIPMSSEDASKKIADKSLDFVYVDADHTYDNCKKDLNLWWGKVKDGGILCGHDFSVDMLGVVRAVIEFTLENRLQLNNVNTYDPIQKTCSNCDWWIYKC